MLWLRLLAISLLVTHSFQAFAALVLVDLLLASFLQRAHTGLLVGSSVYLGRSVNYLVQWILNDTFSARVFQLRDHLAHNLLIDDRFHGHPILARKCGYRRVAQRRQLLQ